MEGIDLTCMENLLEHESRTMRLIYDHLALSDKVKAIERLDNRINEIKSIQKVYNLGK